MLINRSPLTFRGFSTSFSGAIYRAVRSTNVDLLTYCFVSQPVPAAQLQMLKPLSVALNVASLRGNTSQAFGRYLDRGIKAAKDGDTQGQLVNQLWMNLCLANAREKDLLQISAFLESDQLLQGAGDLLGIDHDVMHRVHDILVRTVELDKAEDEAKELGHKRGFVTNDELLWTINRHLGSQWNFVARELGVVPERLSLHLTRRTKRLSEFKEIKDIWEERQEEFNAPYSMDDRYTGWHGVRAFAFLRGARLLFEQNVHLNDRDVEALTRWASEGLITPFLDMKIVASMEYRGRTMTTVREALDLLHI